MNVPLTARGRAFGAIAFCSTTPNRFTNDDLSLAQELAHRASLAIDNAQLYETERLAVSEAESAVRNRDEFLSVAAHELKTPVTSVLGFSQMLLRQIDKGQMPDEQRLTHVLKNLESQNQKLAQLINQLLDISRINGGQLVVDPKPTNITTLVKNVAQMAQENTSKHQIIINSVADYTLSIDPIRIEQVMTNLIDNAIKYSPDGGPIRIDIGAVDPATLEIAVTDQGVGVPTDQRQNLFQKFYRADTGRYFQGIGLGLYICRQIVELHSGVLSAEFPNTGGTRMVICLPLSQQP
jgi:signal transduction histidine kinase